MTGFFDRMLGRNNTPKGSSSTAKDRLKFVLLHERVNIAPEKMREMKAEIVAVIAKYVPGIDPDTVDIAIEQNDRYDNKLVAEIPFTKLRGRPAVDNDENDDLTFNSDDEMIEVAAVADIDNDYKFYDEETIPNPALQDPTVELDIDLYEDEAEPDSSDD
jgi:cell division topological specificity factor